MNGISLGRPFGKMFKKLVIDALGGMRDACFLGELFCRRPVPSGPALPPCRALRPDLGVLCPGFGLYRHDKSDAKACGRRYSGQQPGTKSVCRPRNEQNVHWLSNAGFVPPSVYTRLSLILLPKKLPAVLPINRR